MNILNITKSLHERINSATSLDEILILTKTIDRLNLGTVKTVANYSDLLLEYPREGEVFFVENEEQLYYGFSGLWYLISRTATTIAYAWGTNNNLGWLGDGTTTNKSSPVTVVGGFTDWSEIRLGMGLRADGTIWTWGGTSPNVGQNGDGTTLNRSSPVSIVGGFTDWISINSARTTRFRVALRSSGTIWAWGGNDTGQLGDGTTSARSSPVSVVGGITDWVQITGNVTGSNGTVLALRSNGSIWAWGNNNAGQLGDGTTTNKSSPVSVVGGFTWLSVSSGGSHNLAIRNNNTLWAWGVNSGGVLGDNTTSNRSSPVAVVGGFTDWIFASAGETNSAGIRSNGTLWTWGQNVFGQLGDNTASSRSSPVSVVGGFTDWVQVASGSSVCLGLRGNGTLWAWGAQFSDNTSSSRSSPVLVAGGFSGWVSIDLNSGLSAIRSTT
jgi:alpha-tubulin suppressor-like RCC1 family protein